MDNQEKNPKLCAYCGKPIQNFDEYKKITPIFCDECYQKLLAVISKEQDND